MALSYCSSSTPAHLSVKTHFISLPGSVFLFHLWLFLHAENLGREKLKNWCLYLGPYGVGFLQRSGVYPEAKLCVILSILLSSFTCLCPLLFRMFFFGSDEHQALLYVLLPFTLISLLPTYPVYYGAVFLPLRLLSIKYFYSPCLLLAFYMNTRSVYALFTWTPWKSSLTKLISNKIVQTCFDIWHDSI